MLIAKVTKQADDGFEIKSAVKGTIKDTAEELAMLVTAVADKAEQTKDPKTRVTFVKDVIARILFEEGLTVDRQGRKLFNENGDVNPEAFDDMMQAVIPMTVMNIFDGVLAKMGKDLEAEKKKKEENKKSFFDDLDDLVNGFFKECEKKNEDKR